MKRKKLISALVERNAQTICRVNRDIWDFAEPGMGEYTTAQYYIDLLKQLDFEVESGLSDMETAFCGSWGQGAPHIGFLGEFDALPGLSQQAASPVQQPLENACGQGCGHNSLGAGALGAALALRDYLKETGKPGTVYFYGCPGEEVGSGKAFMARDGVFSHLDACLTWHPSSFNAVVGGGSLAVLSVDFEFHGRTSHAAGSPHLGRSALDAAELTNVGCNYLREHIIPEARLHYGYKNAGNPAPNIVQDYTCITYFVRAPHSDQLMSIYDRVCDVARGAALMTGTTLKMNFGEGCADYRPNHTLGELMQKTLLDLGGADFDDGDYELAREFLKTYSPEECADYKTTLTTLGLPTDTVDPSSLIHRGALPYVKFDGLMGGSTDVGDASYVAPTAQFLGATVPFGTPGHSWQMTALSNSPMAEKGTIFAAKVLALTAVRAMEDAQLLARAKAELLSATGGKPAQLLPEGWKPVMLPKE